MLSNSQRKPSATAVQRNATAVQKIFTEHHARAKALAGVVSSNPVGTTGSPRSPTYATDPVSRDAPVSGPLLPKHSAEAVTGRILAGQIQPEWQQTSRRGVQAHKGHLDIPSHLSQQFELAMEMKQQTAEWGSSPATSASNGLSGPSSPSALSSLPTTGEEQRHNVGGRPVDRKDLLHYEACERPGDPRCSNFAMTLCKSKHQMYIPSAKENPTLTYSGPHGGRERGHSVPVNAVKARREKRAEFHRQQSIARYEKTLPLRRAADPYMQLTGAQADARVSVPTEHTLQLLSERYEGRHPVAGNPYRQELYRGEPLMRQVLRGDFYESAVPATASKPHRTASSPAVRTGKPSSTNFIQKNKRNVREWSDFNTANRYPN